MTTTIVATAFGGPEVLDSVETVVPAPGPREVTVRVRAAGINPFDYKLYSGAFGDDPAARRSCSAWSFPDPAVQDLFTDHLGRDLASGEWDRRHGHLRRLPFYDGSLRLVVSRP